MTASVETPAGLPGWGERSRVPAAMFNPALLAAVTATAAEQYGQQRPAGMPWPLAYLICPLVLHTPTREVLPRTSRTGLAKWVSDHEALSAGFPARASQLAIHVREGLRYGLRAEAFTLTPSATLHSPALPKVATATPGDLAAIIRGAGMLGRIFARTGDAATVFGTLRVQP